MITLTTRDIADRLQGQLHGAADLPITGVDQLSRATVGQLSFIRDQKHADRWATSKASAALVSQGVNLQPGDGRAIIVVPSADVALAAVLGLFAPTPIQPPRSVHASAVVDPSAKLGNDVAIGPHCVIGARVSLGEGCTLHANVTILEGSTLGPHCELHPGVVIHPRCTLGARVNLHANAVIGGEGFGYQPAPDGKGLVKIPHIGTVEIGDDVEIGACTCVDRGKFSATQIGAGTKIDNLCQIAHNVKIGRSCVIAGQAGIAGSATLGDGVMMGGKVAIRDQITIGSGVKIGACAAVMDDIPDGAAWAGYPAQDARVALREQASLRKLPDLVKLMRPRK